MLFKRSIDGVIHAVHVVAEWIALLLGMHLMLLLHLVQLITANPIESVRQTTSLTRDDVAAATPTSNFVTANRPTLSRTDSQRRNLVPAFRVARHQRHLQPLEEALHVHTNRWSVTNHSTLLRKRFGWQARFEHISNLVAEQVYDHIYSMANRIEEANGVAGRALSFIRRCDTSMDRHLISKLPTEIVTHILLLAATPGTRSGVPTKIALLSKAHHRLIMPRLYANIHLTDQASFRHFRMTLAVHNPSLGRHVKALSVASSRFDVEGYMPDQVAEHVTLGVGIEQILLASPNLQHLYLDLFSLAALHNGTASRLEKGALPVSLTTEFSLPQYLALPTFVHLKHVELIVFGLDINAVDWFRQVLPRLQSLTIRWVSRRRGSGSRTQPSSSHMSSSDVAWNDQDDADLEPEEIQSWHEEGRRRNDFLLFVEAIEVLRRWPFHLDNNSSGSRLEAITVLAWPKAYRELRKHYTARENVVFDGVSDEHQPIARWNKSLVKHNEDEQEMLQHLQRQQRQEQSQRQQQQTPVPVAPTPTYFQNARRTSNPDDFPSMAHTPAPLCIGVDEAYDVGTRRGPLKVWCAQQRAAVWPA